MYCSLASCRFLPPDRIIMVCFCLLPLSTKHFALGFHQMEHTRFHIQQRKRISSLIFNLIKTDTSLSGSYYLFSISTEADIILKYEHRLF